LFKDQHYEAARDTEERLGRALAQVDPKFAAQAAIYARHEHGIRSVSHLVAAIVAHEVKGEQWVKDFIYAVVRRVDDMTEIVSAFKQKYPGQPIPNSLKKGLAKAFDKFDRYQLAKYRGEGKGFKLVDLVNLVHPRPSEKNAEALHDLVNGTLRAERTAAVALSEAGKGAKTEEEKTKAKQAAWNQLIVTGDIGYMSLLMNLRNVEQTGDKELIGLAAELLKDPARVKGSLILPFQYLTALAHVSERKIKTALNKAVEISVENMPQLPGQNLIAVDHSGSMGDGLGSRKFQADLFGAMLLTKTDADFMVFGTSAGYASDVYDGQGILTMAQKFGNVPPPGGHGTNFNTIFEKANKPYDRIFIFSDMQSWMGDRYYGTSSQTALDKYKKRKSADPFVYSFDLAGYGTSQFRMEGRSAQIPGLSEKVFQLIGAVEEDREALVHKIEAIDFKTYRAPKG
jgi:60 kDa SS-A/Ro ribonucleoprotein